MEGREASQFSEYTFNFEIHNIFLIIIKKCSFKKETLFLKDEIETKSVKNQTSEIDRTAIKKNFTSDLFLREHTLKEKV